MERHTAATYTSAFCGFAPGFAYLVGLDRSLWVPRRDSPRTRVPPGAVAIADEFAAVYPRESPGGWRIIGHARSVVRSARLLLDPAVPVPLRSLFQSSDSSAVWMIGSPATRIAAPLFELERCGRDHRGDGA